jgi:Ig-like domain from next to BRCA1 gene/Bacterial Ig domain
MLRESLLGAFLLIACQATGGAQANPTLVINSPPSGSSFLEGDNVSIQSTAAVSRGITRIDLLVDGNTIRTDSSPVAHGQLQFSAVQTWKAAGVGNHTVIVRAYNTSGASSDAGLNLLMQQAVAEAVTATSTSATVAPTSTSPPPTNIVAPVNALGNAAIGPVSSPTSPPETPSPSPYACTPNSQYVADVTIPDGTAVEPGSTFVKTWRVRSTGNCAWDQAYSIAFAGGAALANGATPMRRARSSTSPSR